MKNFIGNIKNKLVFFIQLQLFISLCSLPISIAWGLPFSSMSFIGNFIFSPVLTCFLLLSLLTFFTELLCIPNTFLLVLLEYTSSLWLWCMRYGSLTWLISIRYSGPLISVLILIISFGCLHAQKLRTLTYNSFALCILLFGIIIASTSFLARPIEEYITVAYGPNTCVPLIITPYETVIIEHGTLTRSTYQALRSWIQYTLLPLLAQKAGCSNITHLVLLKPSKAAFTLAALLANKQLINHVYCPAWQKNSHYKHLRSLLARSTITHTTLSHNFCLPLQSSTTILTSSALSSNTQNTQPSVYQIHGIVGDQQFTIQPRIPTKRLKRAH